MYFGYRKVVLDEEKPKIKYFVNVDFQPKK
jgi:hypothetical protein